MVRLAEVHKAANPAAGGPAREAAEHAAMQHLQNQLGASAAEREGLADALAQARAEVQQLQRALQAMQVTRQEEQATAEQVSVQGPETPHGGHDANASATEAAQQLAGAQQREAEAIEHLQKAHAQVCPSVYEKDCYDRSPGDGMIVSVHTNVHVKFVRDSCAVSAWQCMWAQVLELSTWLVSTSATLDALHAQLRVQHGKLQV